MKKSNLIFCALLGMGLTACSSDDSIIDGGGSGAALESMSYAPTRASEVAAYSNGHKLAKKQTPIVTITNVAPLDNNEIQNATKTFMDILPEEQDNVNITPNKPGVTNWTTNYLYVSDGKPFTVYPAYSMTASNDVVGIFYYDENGDMFEEDIFDNQDAKPWGYYRNQPGIKITVEKGYKFGFYLRTKYGYNRMDRFGDFVGNVVQTFYTNTKENAGVCSYDAHYWLWDDKPCHGNGVHSASFAYNGRTFFGFEDWEFYNSNFDLNDVVFMVDPALPIQDNPTDDNKKPNVDPTPDPTPDPIPTPDPDPTPSIVAGNGSVEVNFSIYERQYEANETKLSIHVRDTTDVTVVIPTSADYYCAADDMLIVQKHDIAQMYNTTSSVDMNINGNIVTLTTTYSKDNITITTKGINADVLKYLRKTYEDGITFEINSYFATKRIDGDGNEVAITRDELQQILNRTTIAFEKTPAFYLNAFGVLGDTGSVNPLDCNVTPAVPSLFGDMQAEAPKHGETSWLNVWERK